MTEVTSTHGDAYLKYVSRSITAISMSSVVVSHGDRICDTEACQFWSRSCAPAGACRLLPKPHTGRWTLHCNVEVGHTQLDVTAPSIQCQQSERGIWATTAGSHQLPRCTRRAGRSGIQVSIECEFGFVKVSQSNAIGTHKSCRLKVLVITHQPLETGYTRKNLGGSSGVDGWDEWINPVTFFLPETLSIQLERVFMSKCSLRWTTGTPQEFWPGIRVG